MNRSSGRPPTSGLRKPMYVMDMGWDRMSDDARARWLKEFRTQLITALGRTNHELKRLGHDGDTSPLAEAGAYQELGL